MPVCMQQRKQALRDIRVVQMRKHDIQTNICFFILKHYPSASKQSHKNLTMQEHDIRDVSLWPLNT